MGQEFVGKTVRSISLLVLALASMVVYGQERAKPNHLGGQTSPYLKRAASQPVDWYPWSAVAFKRATELGRPILLDVGAVWCPWCSLMDRDTYTNIATAEYINQHFVPIKVDFDATPDLVAQLQRAQAVLNLPAGLPLTSFITPDGRLYFGGGYLPAEHKAGKLSFREATEEALKRYAEKNKINEESFQLEVVRGR
jgi:uncharacterized protein YyaL (SSP411 family)